MGWPMKPDERLEQIWARHERSRWSLLVEAFLDFFAALGRLVFGWLDL